MYTRLQISHFLLMLTDFDWLVSGLGHKVSIGLSEDRDTSGRSQADVSLQRHSRERTLLSDYSSHETETQNALWQGTRSCLPVLWHMEYG